MVPTPSLHASMRTGSVHFATYLGGAMEDRAAAVAVDGNGRAHLVGSTLSADFPTSTGAYDTSYNGVGFAGYDAWLAIVSADGGTLDYGSFFGGADEDRAHALHLAGDEVYVAGSSASTGFPLTAGAIDSELAAGDSADAFLLHFKPSTDSLLYATFWGGGNRDVARGIAVDDAGNVYLSGDSKSAELCTSAGAFDETHNGDADMFALKFTPSTVPTAVDTSQAMAQSQEVWFPLVAVVLGAVSWLLWQQRDKAAVVGNQVG